MPTIYDSMARGTARERMNITEEDLDFLRRSGRSVLQWDSSGRVRYVGGDADRISEKLKQR